MSHISIAATIDHIVKVAHLFNTSLGEHFTVVNGVHQVAIRAGLGNLHRTISGISA